MKAEEARSSAAIATAVFGAVAAKAGFETNNVKAFVTTAAASTLLPLCARGAPRSSLVVSWT